MITIKLWWISSRRAIAFNFGEIAFLSRCERVSRGTNRYRPNMCVLALMNGQTPVCGFWVARNAMLRSAETCGCFRTCVQSHFQGLLLRQKKKNSLSTQIRWMFSITFSLMDFFMSFFSHFQNKNKREKNTWKHKKINRIFFDGFFFSEYGMFTSVNRIP